MTQLLQKKGTLFLSIAVIAFLTALLGEINLTPFNELPFRIGLGSIFFFFLYFSLFLYYYNSFFVLNQYYYINTKEKSVSNNTLSFLLFFVNSNFYEITISCCTSMNDSSNRICNTAFSSDYSS